MQRIGVLLADAHPIFRQGLRALLGREQDIEVLGDTGEGNRVGRLVQQLLPRVVVTDVQLPGTTTTELVESIRQSSPSAEILVLTTKMSPFYVLGMIRAGARGYILKQSADIDLAEAIRKVNGREAVLDPDIVRTIVDDIHKSGAPHHEETVLTRRECEIMEHLAGGESSRKIAEALGVSQKTVDKRRAQILVKMRARNMVQAIATALEQDIIRLAPSPRDRMLTE